MNLRTRLSRSNGYRELGMFDESILILEDIPFERGSLASISRGSSLQHLQRCEGMGTSYDHGKASSMRVNLTVLSGY